METERLVLRPWELSDAEDLYEVARDERVGPRTGWPAHTSVQNSREIIEHVLAFPEIYAVVDRETDRAIGSIGLHTAGDSFLVKSEREYELGYWLGPEYWGRGLMPEAAGRVLGHAFEDLACEKIWSAYYEGNAQSRRVLEKLGFKDEFVLEKVAVTLLKETRTEHVLSLDRQTWENTRQERNTEENGRHPS